MKHILNLYSSRKEAFEAFNSDTINRHNIKVIARDLLVQSNSENITIYRWFTTYAEARVTVLCGVYQEINFFCELPEKVKLHFLSRIRPDYNANSVRAP